MTIDIYEPGFSDPSPELCPHNGRDVHVVALIHSAPQNFETRDAIRLTWGHFGMRRDMVIGFLVGQTENVTLEKDLQAEQFLYGDVVRSNSFDSYKNLTLKTISMLEWVTTFCHRTKFLLKVDDDVFINVPKLLEFTECHLEYKRRIFGRLLQRVQPVRRKDTKYFVSRQQFPGHFFPDFVTGPAYLITGDLVRELFEASLRHPFLPLEDVYVTGIVAQEVKARLRHLPQLLNRKIRYDTCVLRKYISIHRVKFNKQLHLWKKIMNKDIKCR